MASSASSSSVSASALASAQVSSSAVTSTSVPVSNSTVVSASVPESSGVATSGVTIESKVTTIAQDLLRLGLSNVAKVSNVSSSVVDSSNVSASTVLSDIELKILRSENPIDFQASEEITVLGERGVWINKHEVEAWRGDLDISEYKIHEDLNPQIITKRVKQEVEYVQELAVRYLRPPTPPAPGEIVITQEANLNTKPAPPLIIRQQPARAETPEPLVVREAPPEAPLPVGRKLITISGRRNPPPPRKVIIERLAPLPAKPQNVLIERWLPYAVSKRRVVFNRAAEVKAEVTTPRNVIIQWEAPSVNIRKEIKYLGVINANPIEYVEKYGSSLKVHTSLPQFVLDIATPSEVGVLAADYNSKQVLELEGELEAFKLVNLDAEGLSEYRTQLLGAGIRDLGASGSSSIQFTSTAAPVSAQASGSASASAFSLMASQIFSTIDKNNNGTVTLDEAGSILLKLNSQLNRSYGSSEAREFFAVVSDGASTISREQFMAAFEKLANE